LTGICHIMKGSFTGESERYVKLGSEIGVRFHRAQLLGNVEGRFFLTAFLFRAHFRSLNVLLTVHLDGN